MMILSRKRLRLSMVAISVLCFLLIPAGGFGFTKGDINGDGKVNLLESVNALQITAGNKQAEEGSTMHVPGDFSTIQDAVDAADEGDTIMIAAGSYTENINIIYKTNLNIYGDPAGGTILNTKAVTIDGRERNYSLRIKNSRDIRIGNLTVTGNNASEACIDIISSPLVYLTGITVKESAWAGLLADKLSYIFSSDSTFESCMYGIVFRESATSTLVNCTVQNNAKDGISVSINSGCKIQGGMIRNNERSGIDVNTNSVVVLNSDESPVIIENNKDTGVNVQNNSTLQSWFDENKSPASITRISGNYAGNIGEIGIQVKGNSTADLSGCEVTNFNRYGIRVSRNSSLKGKSLKVHDINNCGIRIQESSSAWVSENSDVFNNRKEGIYVREGSTLNLENSRIRDNRRHGMRASMHCYANITNTEISGNHENGLYYSNYSGGGIYNSLVKGNCIAGSDWIAGIYITGSSHAEIGIEKEDENDPDPVAVISGNKANGLSVSDQSRVSFFIEDDGLSAPARISISDNSYHGVKLDYRSSLKAGRSLDISNNLAHGIFLTKQCQLDLGGDYEPENSQKVTISGNGNNGIYAMNRSTVNLSAVTIATNGGDGLALYDDSYTNISKNNESAQAAPEFSGNVKNGISINSSGLHISDAIIRYTEMGIWYCEATTLHIADSVTFPEAGDANNNTVKCGGEIPVL